MPFFLKSFVHENTSLFVTEFGHSAHSKPKTVGPWSREIYILHFITKGYADFSGFRAEAGQAFLISKERLHSFTISEDYEHYWIGFDGELIDTLFDNFGLEYKDHQLFFVEHSDFIKILFSSACEKLESENLDSAEALVLSTLISTLPLLRKEMQAKTPRKVDYAEKAYILIKDKYMYPLRMRDIAKEIHISEKYMYRLFIERFRISPQQFLIKTRMEVARELLQKNNLSVSETATAVGYASIFAFSKTFLNYFGVNPSSFKK